MKQVIRQLSSMQRSYYDSQLRRIWEKESVRRPGLLGTATELNSFISGESGACGVLQLPNTTGNRSTHQRPQQHQPIDSMYEMLREILV
ncbi:hypothetical protein HZ326_10636 [Fusarium oxysporum f. sp. albedinis]|nr:hypothetical protein HZ326_10636 [Fusarium oxysporum f. sp. albedinis]